MHSHRDHVDLKADHGRNILDLCLGGLSLDHLRS